MAFRAFHSKALVMKKHDPSSQTMRIEIDSLSTAIPLDSPSRVVPTTFSSRREARAKNNSPYDKLLSSIYDAVLITDIDGIISDFNSRAIEFFLTDEANLLGRSVLSLISGANESLLCAIRRNLEENKYTVAEARCLRSDGSSFPAEIAVNKIELDEHGQLCFLVRDITIRHKAQKELEHALERVEAMSRRRMEFVSNVSHELRTPLTSMIYAVKNMQRGIAGPLPEKAVHYLDRLEADCNRLLGTVNDILDLRQIENNTITLVKALVPFPLLVANALESLRVQAKTKNIRLISCRCPSAGFVMCDAQKIERVVINVVGNAIKFTPEGGTIHVCVEPSEKDPGFLNFIVADSGIGIPKDDIPKVTDRYYQVGDQPRGTGLGLAITSELVKLHGGKLKIDSPVPGTEKGTQVSIQLPLTESPRIAIISNDPHFEERAEHFRAQMTLRAEVYTSGVVAVNACRKNPPDMIIMGETTYDLGPSNLIAQIRNDRSTMRVPLLFVTTKDTLPATLSLLKAFHIPTVAKFSSDSEIRSIVLSTFLPNYISSK